MQRIPLLSKYELLDPISRTRPVFEVTRDEATDPTQSPLVLTGLFVLIVAQTEGLLIDLLSAFLSEHPERLPNDLTISGAMALEHATTSHLVTDLVRRRTNKILEKDLRAGLKTFFDTLGIEACLPDTVEILLEAKERRNRIVHPGSAMERTTWGLEFAPRDEVFKVAEGYLTFIDHLETAISNEYGHLTRIAVLKALWEHIFRTPLLRPFESFWRCDAVDDSITAHLISDKTLKSISHSERMYLEIWLSHFTGRHKAVSFNIRSISDDQTFFWFLEKLRIHTLWGPKFSDTAK